MEDKIDTIRNALEEARQSLHQTVAELNQKVATVSTHLEPEVERHLLLAACIAAALGFATGKSGGRLVGVATLVLGGLLGAVLTEASNHGFGNHDTTAT
jgi:ABC-type transporter Mla subunit MlaD